ncbi:MAG: hypothetical protein QXG05_01755 [Nitrososphaerota archaeon]
MQRSKRTRTIFAITIVFIILVLYSLPLIIPSGIAISSISLKGNPDIALTSNPSFENGLASWSVRLFNSSYVAVSSGQALSGVHSLFINAAPQDTGTAIIYGNSSTLPIVLSDSIVYSFSVYYNGSGETAQSSALDSVITISYQGRYNISLLVFVTTSGPTNGTEIRMTTLGISLVRGITPESSWQTFILQLGTPRMIQLYQEFLHQQYGINALPSLSYYFVMGFYVHPNDIICYLDDVGLYNIFPATMDISVSKASPFPSNSYLKGIFVNGLNVEVYSYKYGLLSDSYAIQLAIPLVKGLSISIQLLTVSGVRQVYNYTITSGPISI